MTSLDIINKNLALAQSLKVTKKSHLFGNMEDKAFVKALEKAQKWQKKYAKAEDIPDEEIPTKYSFKDIEGFDFTLAVRD